jgi:hypothetical protein
MQRRQREIERQIEHDDAMRRKTEEAASRNEKAEAIARRRDEASEAKRRKEQYLALRRSEADERTREAMELIAGLGSLLSSSLKREPTFDIAEMFPFPSAAVPHFPPVSVPSQPGRDQFFEGLREGPSLVEKLFGFGRARRLQGIDQAEASYTASLEEFEEHLSLARVNIQRQILALVEARRAWLTALAERETAISQFRDALQAGDPEAVEAVATLILEHSEYPSALVEDFDVDVACNPATRELVIRYRHSDKSSWRFPDEQAA